MSTITSGEIQETEMIWALDLAGRKVHGPATMVETRTDDCGTPPLGLSGVRHVRALPQQLIVHFLDGEIEAKYVATSEAGVDTIIDFQRAEQHRAEVERERIKREQSNRVKVTDLVGHVIRKVQMDERTIIFTLEDEHVWAFDNLYGVWGGAVERPWVLTNGGTVTEVQANYSLMLFTDKPGYLTIPAIIENLMEYDEGLDVGYAYEPSSEQLRTLPVIAGRE